MSESICVLYAAFHLMVLLPIKEGVLAFHTVMFSIPAVFREKTSRSIFMI